MSARGEIFRFGPFELVPEAEELRKNGTLIHLPHQPLRILELLLARPGQIVTREEIQEAIWGPETFVDFRQGINTAIRQIRFALNDTAETPRYVQTLPRKGYRFIGPVQLVAAPSGARPSIVSTEEAAPDPEPAPPPVVVPAKNSHAPAVAIAVAAFAAIAILVTMLLWRDRDATASPALPARKAATLTVHVQPFRVVGTRPKAIDERNFTEEVVSSLGELPESVRVVANAREADLLLDGTLQAAQNGVRVTVRGVDPKTRAQLWTETYHRESEATYALPIEVSLRLRRSIAQRYLPPPRTAPLVRTKVSPEALGLYRQGRTERARPSPQRDLDRAIALFEQALELEPRFAEAWSGIGDIHAERAGSMRGEERAQAIARARAALNRAIALDPNCAEAHNDLGLLLMQFDHAYSAAEDALRRAVAADPDYVDAHFNLALLLAAMGSHDAAVAEFRRARQLSVADFSPSPTLGFIYFLGRRYDDAIAEYRASLIMQVRPRYARWGLLSTAMARGQWEDAAKIAAAMVPPSERGKPFKEIFLSLEGELLTLYRAGVVDDYTLASYYAQCGAADKAFARLDAAIELQAPAAMYLFNDPRFDNVRNDPRFATRLTRLGFK